MEIMPSSRQANPDSLSELGVYCCIVGTALPWHALDTGAKRLLRGLSG